jgi:hypothetical protein
LPQENQNVRDREHNHYYDIETAVKLATDLQDIISETEKKKQVQDVKDLVQRLETTLENAIVEKQNEEERIVSAYIKELEKCTTESIIFTLVFGTFVFNYQLILSIFSFIRLFLFLFFSNQPNFVSTGMIMATRVASVLNQFQQHQQNVQVL